MMPCRIDDATPTMSSHIPITPPIRPPSPDHRQNGWSGLPKAVDYGPVVLSKPQSHMRSRSMSRPTRFLGPDVHSKAIAIASAVGRRQRRSRCPPTSTSARSTARIHRMHLVFFGCPVDTGEEREVVAGRAPGFRTPDFPESGCQTFRNSHHLFGARPGHVDSRRQTRSWRQPGPRATCWLCADSDCSSPSSHSRLVTSATTMGRARERLGR